MAVGVFRVFLVLAFACLLGFSHLARFVNGQHGSGHSRLSFVYTREYLLSLCDFAGSLDLQNMTFPGEMMPRIFISHSDDDNWRGKRRKWGAIRQN